MTAIAIDATAEAFARRLEDRERQRSSVSLPVARQAVARRTGVPAGTLENLRRGRIKGVREWVADRLRSALISELEAEFARTEHELAFLRASHRRVDQGQIVQVEASLAALRETLRAG